MSETKPRILIVDDDRTVCQSLRLLFMTRGFEVQYLINPLNVIAFIGSFKPDILLLDLNFSVETSGKEGLMILKEIRQVYAGLPVILFTAWGTLDLAVRGMKTGASDFITKPWDNEGVISAVNTQLKLNGSRQETLLQKLDNIIGQSEAIQKVRSLMLSAAPTHAPVLITGEQGTGKELVAEALHDLSLRKEHPFIKADVAGLPGMLLERELLGYRKGVFPEAGADHRGLLSRAGEGTLFLDEIGEIPIPVQSKLLRATEERLFEPQGSDLTEKLKCRFVSSSRLDTEKLIREGRFREDLFYRLSLVHIHLPPLAERAEDIPLLAAHFSEKLNQGEKKRKMEDRALDWLSTQEFPGNVRQLKNLIERTWLLSDNYNLTIKELKKNLSSESAREGSLMTLEEMEKSMIRKAIAAKKGNMSEVAKKLGITRSSLYRRMSKFGISNPDMDES